MQSGDFFYFLKNCVSIRRRSSLQILGMLLVARPGHAAAGSVSRPADKLFPRAEIKMPALPFLGRIVNVEIGSPAIADREGWEKELSRYSAEGYTAIIWMIGELSFNGAQTMLRIEDYPEARELPPEQVEKNIADFTLMFQCAHKLGLRTYLYVSGVAYTKAFARAHDLARPLPASLTVSVEQDDGPEHWNPHGVRTELTRKYVESLYGEMIRTYPDLDGFYGVMGEALPGRRSTWFKEAIAPALRKAARKVHYIVHQWQVPMQQYIEDIAPAEIYDNTWLALHAYNSEQATDAAPYPFVVEWAREVGLPTIFAYYPANIQNFPFNSPRFAYEVAQEMKWVPNARGFAYWCHAGEKLSWLFNQALVYYAGHDDVYSDEPWVKIIEKQYGDREAARHFVNAFNASGKLFPELCALVYCPHDNWRRELRLPYYFMTPDWAPFAWETSRVRGAALQPIWNYTLWSQRDPFQYENNTGWSLDRGKPTAHDNYRQIAAWRTEGGSNYDILPLDHMAAIRALADQALSEAEAGLPLVKSNRAHAQAMRDFMQAYQMLARYWETKVKAGIAALQVRYGGGSEKRALAEKWADQALAQYLEAAAFMQAQLDPWLKANRGRPMISEGKGMDKIIEEEKADRQQLAKTFNWPQDITGNSTQP